MHLAIWFLNVPPLHFVTVARRLPQEKFFDRLGNMLKDELESGSFGFGESELDRIFFSSSLKEILQNVNFKVLAEK